MKLKNQLGVLLLSFCLVGVLSFSAKAYSQEEAEPQRPYHEAAQKIMMERIDKELKLSAEQKKSLDLLLEEHQKQRHSFKKQQRELRAELRQNLAKGSESQLSDILKKLDGLRGEMRQEEIRFSDQISGLLSVKQRAQLILIMDEMKDKKGRMKRAQ